MEKPIGILGGTFDPIHFGHLRLGLEILENFHLQKIHFVPCYQPVHRELPIANVDKRVEMLKLAIKDETNFLLDLREIKREGPSYFIDTILNFREEMPQVPLCLILGLDAFLDFSKWHRYSEILQHCHIILAHRPQYQLPNNGQLAKYLDDHLQKDIQYIHHRLSGGILLQQITALEISASNIRKQIALSQNPKYLLPNIVYDYIRQYSIYRSA